MPTGRTVIRTQGRLAALILWVVLPVRAVEFAGGTGEPNDPYQIATAEQLVSIGSDANLLDKHFVLLNDIDLDPNLPGGRVFTKALIAPTTGGKAVFWAGVPFTGSLDGRGHEVRNLTIRAGGAGYLGLFGYLGKRGVAKSLGIVDADVGEGQWQCGALAGISEGAIRRCYAQSHVSGVSFAGVLVGGNHGEILDCRAEGEVLGGESFGGLVGENGWEGTIRNSHASSRVVSRRAGDCWVGGLVGRNWGALVNCYASGDISTLANTEAVGGLAGANGGSIVNCHATGNICATQGRSIGGLIGENNWFLVHSYATGNVSAGTSMYGSRDGKPVASQALGGLVGWNNYGHVHACYASGDVTGGDGSRSLGGLVGGQGGDVVDSYCVGRARAGENSTAVGGLAGGGASGITGCFWDIESSGLTQSAGGTGLTTGQMQDAATFLAAGWDWVSEQANGLVDPWFIPEGGGYPMLTFQSDAFQPRQLEGSGTADDPYRIATAEDLGAINHYDPTACYRLQADIDLAGITWKASPVWYFDGRFEGSGRSVSNLSVQGDTGLGLFGLLNRNASVVNLGIRDANIMGRFSLGMLAGWNSGRIVACRADGVVSGIDGLGGLTGSNDGSISDSYATGGVITIDPKPEAVAGLTGSNIAGSINRCYAAAYITSAEFEPGYVDVTGGLVGDNNGNPFIYVPAPGEVHDSYFLTESDGGGPDNGFGTALSDTQMKQQGSFAGWDFDGTWTICEGRGYPRLWWEGAACEP